MKLSRRCQLPKLQNFLVALKVLKPETFDNFDLLKFRRPQPGRIQDFLGGETRPLESAPHLKKALTLVSKMPTGRTKKGKNLSEKSSLCFQEGARHHLPP